MFFPQCALGMSSRGRCSHFLTFLALHLQHGVIWVDIVALDVESSDVLHAHQHLRQCSESIVRKKEALKTCKLTDFDRQLTDLEIAQSSSVTVKHSASRQKAAQESASIYSFQPDLVATDVKGGQAQKVAELARKICEHVVGYRKRFQVGARGKRSRYLFQRVPAHVQVFQCCVCSYMGIQVLNVVV
jgi:hypothetical protein